MPRKVSLTAQHRQPKVSQSQFTETDNTTVAPRTSQTPQYPHVRYVAQPLTSLSTSTAFTRDSHGVALPGNKNVAPSTATCNDSTTMPSTSILTGAGLAGRLQPLPPALRASSQQLSQQKKSSLCSIQIHQQSSARSESLRPVVVAPASSRGSSRNQTSNVQIRKVSTPLGHDLPMAHSRSSAGVRSKILPSGHHESSSKPLCIELIKLSNSSKASESCRAPMRYDPVGPCSSKQISNEMYGRSQDFIHSRSHKVSAHSVGSMSSAGEGRNRGSEQRSSRIKQQHTETLPSKQPLRDTSNIRSTSTKRNKMAGRASRNYERKVSRKNSVSALGTEVCESQQPWEGGIKVRGGPREIDVQNSFRQIAIITHVRNLVGYLKNPPKEESKNVRKKVANPVKIESKTSKELKDDLLNDEVFLSLLDEHVPFEHVHAAPYYDHNFTDDIPLPNMNIPVEDNINIDELEAIVNELDGDLGVPAKEDNEIKRCIYSPPYLSQESAKQCEPSKAIDHTLAQCVPIDTDIMTDDTTQDTRPDDTIRGLDKGALGNADNTVIEDVLQTVSQKESLDQRNVNDSNHIHSPTYLYGDKSEAEKPYIKEIDNTKTENILLSNLVNAWKCFEISNLSIVSSDIIGTNNSVYKKEEASKDKELHGVKSKNTATKATKKVKQHPVITAETASVSRAPSYKASDQVPSTSRGERSNRRWIKEFLPGVSENLPNEPHEPCRSGFSGIVSSIILINTLEIWHKLDPRKPKNMGLFTILMECNEDARVGNFRSDSFERLRAQMGTIDPAFLGKKEVSPTFFINSLFKMLQDRSADLHSCIDKNISITLNLYMRCIYPHCLAVSNELIKTNILPLLPNPALNVNTPKDLFIHSFKKHIDYGKCPICHRQEYRHQHLTVEKADRYMLASVEMDESHLNLFQGTINILRRKFSTSIAIIDHGVNEGGDQYSTLFHTGDHHFLFKDGKRIRITLEEATKLCWKKSLVILCQ